MQKLEPRVPSTGAQCTFLENAKWRSCRGNSLEAPLYFLRISIAGILTSVNTFCFDLEAAPLLKLEDNTLHRQGRLLKYADFRSR